MIIYLHYAQAEREEKEELEEAHGVCLGSSLGGRRRRRGRGECGTRRLVVMMMISQESRSLGHILHLIFVFFVFVDQAHHSVHFFVLLLLLFLAAFAVYFLNANRGLGHCAGAKISAAAACGVRGATRLLLLLLHKVIVVAL